MSTLTVVNVKHPSSIANNLVLDSSGDITIGSDLYVNSAMYINNSTGSNGDILTSNASGRLYWNLPMRQLLATYTASSSATLGATNILTGYSDYEIAFHNIVPVTSATILELQWYAGGSFAASSYVTYTATFNTGGSAGYSPTTYIDLCGGGRVNNAVNAGASGYIRLFNAASTTVVKQHISHCSTYDSTNSGIARSWGGGFLNVGTAVTGFQIFMSSGNISTGTVKVYGLR